MTLDEQFMQKALQLAAYARGQTSPNPIVGAVVVNDGEIVGYGSHLKAGTPHAEVHALRIAGARAAGATVYVTLEPCSHFGRTPPCADALIEAGVRRVVIACLDPNPEVSGSGVAKLKAAGVEVTVGVLERPARQLNVEFFTWVTKGRPFVIWKCAATLDGYIATETRDSLYVTGVQARNSVQKLRSETPAIAVGIQTVLSDNPRLTVRYDEGMSDRQPLRVIFDSHLRLPASARILTEPGKTLVYTTHEGARGERDPKLERHAQQGTLQIVPVDADGNGRVALQDALQHLAAQGIHSVLVEGGSQLVSSLMQLQLVDKVIYYVAPKLLGGGIPALCGLHTHAMNDAVKLADVQTSMVGDDLCIEGVPVYHGAPDW